ncbi:hypothetical protein B0H67DRAFT_71548 [Lasiosphaeris hirsuta]|uniref:Uncharacterized protein n=1 Tax=Lasiosphaeris hirsuta TaxID=260670 RepID=A0AA40BBU0_9PEZI|nr:hypothetical protein B0H67DRAFT_71548 [Lasiosphaeris hirsuta]
MSAVVGSLPAGGRGKSNKGRDNATQSACDYPRALCCTTPSERLPLALRLRTPLLMVPSQRFGRLQRSLIGDNPRNCGIRHRHIIARTAFMNHGPAGEGPCQATRAWVWGVVQCVLLAGRPSIACRPRLSWPPSGLRLASFSHLPIFVPNSHPPQEALRSGVAASRRQVKAPLAIMHGTRSEHGRLGRQRSSLFFHGNDGLVTEYPD